MDYDNGCFLDRADVIAHAFKLATRGDVAGAGGLIRRQYPFAKTTSHGRQYSIAQCQQIFHRDGFIDRYCGQKLIFPGVLRLFSKLLPQEFPFQRNWKMTDTHPAFWELFPTIDHIVPVARGGEDSQDNWATTSMLRNAAKANWTLEELGWSLQPPESLRSWDGLSSAFVNFVAKNPLFLDDPYLRRWHFVAVSA